MAADTNNLTADSKERFPFPREVRFNRSAHSAVPTLMDGCEDDFRFEKFGKTHLCFCRYVLSINQSYCAMDGTETLLEIPALLWGGNRSRWLSESNILYDCKRLHAAKKECVGSQRIFWVLEEEFWCLTRTYFSTLCGVDRLCMLHTDIMCSQHRRQFWGL